jgi:TonB-dependent starch-binding outer membrane protein SusC
MIGITSGLIIKSAITTTTPRKCLTITYKLMKNNPNLTLHPLCSVNKKTLRTMKLLVICLIFSVLNAAGSVYSQKTFNLSYENITVGEVLREIENNSDYKFLYRNDFIDLDRKINLKVTDTQVEDLLARIFPSDDASFRFFEDNLIAITNTRLSQQSVVTGTVTDARTGEYLPGVNIMIEGTMIGTITNMDGKYSITVDVPNPVLVFSFIGYMNQRVPVEGRQVIDVAMTVDLAELDEVVVVGYGTQRRREVTSSIATVREEDFNRGAVTQSPLQLVQGKIAGLAISRSSGGDPNASVQMQLRGVSTVRGDASPLIIIDGIPGGNINTLAPEDITSIDVLRDGSAAAIYGTRGNAGVIIITTKKGTPGRPVVTYSAYGYTENWLNKPNVLNATEWRQMRTDFENSGNEALQSKASSIVDYGADTDWFNEITRRTPISHVHNLSISGGSESTSYYGSINYRDLQGFILQSGNNILNGRLAVTHSGLNDKLIVQMNLSNTNRMANPIDYGVYRQAMQRNPTLPVYNSDGSFREESGWELYNPVAQLYQRQEDIQRDELLASTQASYALTPNLRVTATGALQRSNTLMGEFLQRDAFASVQGGYNGQARRASALGIDRTFESTLNYNNVFDGIHNVTLMGGYSYQDFSWEGFGARNRFFITNAFGYNNLGAGLHLRDGKYNTADFHFDGHNRGGDIWSQKNSSRLIAFFGRANYSYDDIYMLSASLRREGSSRFGADNKWGLFPAVSAGWTISRESFMENVGFISDLKLRAGYGITGNQGIPNYISLERLGNQNMMLYDGNWISGFGPVSNPNPDLRWERKAETNIGIDAAFFNNSVSINLDVYNRSTTDLLFEYAVPVPPNLHNTMWTNIGEMNNRGIEFAIQASPVQTSSFSWRTNFNISYNQNELVSLSNDLYQTTYQDLENIGAPGLNATPAFRMEEGQPIGNLFGWRHAGFTDDGKWLFWNADNTERLLASEITYEDKTIIGNGLPKSWMGFTNTFAYGNLDLTVFLRGAFGFHLLNTRRIFFENRVMVPTNIFKEGLDSPVIDDPQYSDYYVERGDYVKLDNLTLGYNIPVTGQTFQSLRVYASGQNLLTLTGYKGQDPEIGITGLTPGMDYRWIYPSVRTFTFGVNVQF